MSWLSRQGKCLLSGVAGQRELPICLIRGTAVQRGMRPFAVRVIDPLLQPLPEFAAISKGMLIHAFVFQGTLQALNHHIAAPASLAVHGNANPGSLQSINKAITRKLAALIRTKNIWRP